MSSEKEIKVSVDSDFVWAVVVAFLLFWAQSGWYRVDCSLGNEKACALIADEYAKDETP